jgi:multicomponent Na+:H+ antiporter subunit D
MGGLARRRPLLTAAFTVGALSIAGVPPFNGYASLGLIHDGLADQPAVLVSLLVAQVLTVAALGRATYRAFYRRRDSNYEHLEPIRPGMQSSLVVLGAGCLAFGVGAALFVPHVAAPAAAGLLQAACYAAAALGTHCAPSSLTVDFDYLDPAGLLLTAVELAAGAAVMVLAIRGRAINRSLRWLRRLHTGSVNDYATFFALGVVAVAAALLA